MTHQVEYRHLHHTLVKIGCPILDNLDCDNLLRFEILTLDDLSKSSLAKHIQDQISVPASQLAAHSR